MKAIVILFLTSLMLTTVRACDPLTMNGIPDIIKGYGWTIVDTDSN